MEKFVYLMLNILYRVDISYYGDLESFLTVVFYNFEHKMMIRVEACW